MRLILFYNSVFAAGDGAGCRARGGLGETVRWGKNRAGKQWRAAAAPQAAKRGAWGSNWLPNAVLGVV
jgi:hypothetical protein